MFFKKTPAFLILFALCTPFSPYAFGKGGKLPEVPTSENQSSKQTSASSESDEISASIKNLVKWFTKEKFKEAKNDWQESQDKLPKEKQQAWPVSEETEKFILEAKNELENYIRIGDAQFKDIPGYTDLKKKLLNYIKKFSVCLGYGKEEIEKLTTEILDLEKKIKNEQENTGAQKISKKEKILKDRKSKLETTQNKMSEKERTDLEEEIATREKEIGTLKKENKKVEDEDIKKTFPESKILPTFINLKKDYLNKLQELESLSRQEAIQHQKDQWGLTLIEACKWKLKHFNEQFNKLSTDHEEKLKKINEAFDQLDKKPEEDTKQHKTNKEQEENRFKEQTKGIKKTYTKTFKQLAALDKNSAQPFEKTEWGTTLIEEHGQQIADAPYDAYAIGLRGTLFELEAALQAKKHGEKIISFGTLVTISVDEKDNATILQKIEKHSSNDANSNSFLSPTRPKNIKQIILSQEFDLVTTRHIIECKCIQGNVDKYIDNLNREQFMSILSKKSEIAPNNIVITSGGENYPKVLDISAKKWSVISNIQLQNTPRHKQRKKCN